MPELARTGETVFRGIPVSPGVARGRVLVLRTPQDTIPSHSISPAQFPSELKRLEDALVKTRQQILEVQRKVSEAMGAEDASIFEAHLLVLEDRTLLDEVTRVMEHQSVNVEQAFSQVSEKYAATLGAIDDEYLRERAADMRDVTTRVLNNLLNRQHCNLSGLTEPCIIVGHDLTPSMTATLDKGMVLGFATDVGGRTSHTAIMARSLQIPAIVGLQNLSARLGDGEHVLLDGYTGSFILNPSDQTLFEYGQIVSRRADLEQKLQGVHDAAAVTLDGTRIILSANVENAGDIEAVKASGAEGVGLFRTEFLFISRPAPPTEEEQFAAYHAVAAALKPAPVVIRTLDLGGDKFLPNLHAPQELNPFLGYRAIRFCLQEHALFKAQLRAMLRASIEGNVKIMYPMISCREELDDANRILDECRQELTDKNVPFDRNLEVGVMMEIPSAILIADTLAKRVKFFSIGTNDLIQYSLAVDRLNEKIAHLYEPTHPAIVRLIKMTVEAGRKQGIWTGVCGEIASDLDLVPLLLGLGVDELSAAPPFIPHIKFLIRRLKITEARELADFALSCEAGEEILARSQNLARQAAPSLFENKA